MSKDNTPRPDTSAQWLARVFHWVDSTEKNVVWTVEKAKAWRRMADDQWHTLWNSCLESVNVRTHRLRDTMQNRAKEQARKLGIATPDDMDALTQAVEDLQTALDHWLGRESATVTDVSTTVSKTASRSASNSVSNPMSKAVARDDEKVAMSDCT